MSKVEQSQLLTEEEYLEGENLSDVKHEYIDGRVYAMVGATWGHNTISGNIFRKMGNHLEGKPCKPGTSDVKIKVENNFYYPDVLVDCSNTMNRKSLFTENPTIIVEVLSDSTQTYDRKGKFDAYRNIPSLEEYVLVEQNLICVYIFRRDQNWHGEIYSKGEKVTFESIGLTLPIEEIYRDVDFEEFKEKNEA